MAKEFNIPTQQSQLNESTTNTNVHISTPCVQQPGDAVLNLTHRGNAPETRSEDLFAQIPNLVIREQH